MGWGFTRLGPHRLPPPVHDPLYSAWQGVDSPGPGPGVLTVTAYWQRPLCDRASVSDGKGLRHGDSRGQPDVRVSANRTSSPAAGRPEGPGRRIKILLECDCTEAAGP